MTPVKVIIKLFLIISSVILTSSSFGESTTNGYQVKNRKVHGEYTRERFLKQMNKPFELSDQNELKPKVLIIGDSHAQDFLNAIAENNLLSGSQIRTRYIPTRCQIYLGDSSKRNWLESDRKLCNKSDNLEKAQTQIANADVIILAALWRKWAALQLPQTINNLTLSAKQKLYVIGRRSFLGLDKKTLSKRSEVDVHQLEINKIMNNLLDKRIFIDVHKLVCGTGSTCPLYTDKSQLISLDGGHLSQDGARYIGKILFEKSQLSSLLK